MLFGCILLFAFLLASFPARNLDLWVRLADGSDLVRGQITPGPGFLFDLIVWAGTISFGPSLMVLFKALLVGLLARNLLKLIGADSPWIAALGAGLALLAMSNRLLMQPGVLSLLLTSVVMLRLWPPDKSPEPPGVSWFLIFVAWGLIDPSFWMPVAVLIAAFVGEMVDAHLRRLKGAVAWRWIAACLVGCASWGLLEVFSGAGILQAINDWAGPEGWYRSPFGAEYFAQALNSPAGLAFFPLIILSVFGMVLGFPEFRWSRCLPWAVAGLAACLNYRLIPWFALFAGPVFAWGIAHHFGSGVQKSGPFQEQWKLSPWGQKAIPVFGWSILLLFLFCAWPGWLQLPPYGPRIWGYDPHPSWERAGRKVVDLAASKALPEKFSVAVPSRAMARALSWFHPSVAWSFKPALLMEGNTDPGTELVLVLDTDHGRWLQTAQKMFVLDPMWRTIDLDGSYALFAKGDLPMGALPEWNPNKVAFAIPGSAKDEEDFADSPIPEDADTPWYRPFFRATSGWKPWRDHAELLLMVAEYQRLKAPGKAMRSWVSLQSGGLIASAFGWAPFGSPGLPVESLLKIQMVGPFRAGAFDPRSLTPAENWVLSLQDFYGTFYGEISPAALYLAIQALRREARENPMDGTTRNRLAEAYQRLLFNSKEKSWGRRVPGLMQLRRVQVARALTEAVRLAPDLADARFALGMHYQELGYRDLTFLELKRHQALIVSRPWPPGPEAAKLIKQLNDNVKKLERMEQDVQRRLDSFHRDAPGLRIFDRAQLALELGLAGTALETLLTSDISAFGAPGMQMEIQLLLFTGGARQVRDWTGGEELDNQDLQTHVWTQIQAFSALGQYGSARKQCQYLSFPADVESEKQPPRVLAGLVLGQAVLEGIGAQLSPAALAAQAFNRQRTQGRLDGLAGELRGEAEGLVLAGLLALEEGRTGLAKSYFEQALAIRGRADIDTTWDFESRTLAEGFLGLIREANQ